jgi:hypothetical protein
MLLSRALLFRIGLECLLLCNYLGVLLALEHVPQRCATEQHAAQFGIMLSCSIYCQGRRGRSLLETRQAPFTFEAPLRSKRQLLAERRFSWDCRGCQAFWCRKRTIDESGSLRCRSLLLCNQLLAERREYL